MSFLVVVTGSRYWHYAAPIIEEFQAFPDGTVLMHGGAPGADDMAAAVAKIMCPNICEVIPVRAEWTKYGKKAGSIRNKKMIDCHPDLVLAFHNDLANSKGTGDMVKRAIKAGIPFRHISVGDIGHEIAARRWSGNEDISTSPPGRQYGQSDYGATQMIKEGKT